jgi:4'-phosphopantetheinyl transferase
MIDVFGVKILKESVFMALHERLEALNPRHFSLLKQQFKNVASMQRRFLSELLVKALAVKRFKLPKSEIAIGFGQNSKPFFEVHPELHYNLSHSGDWVVAAFSDSPVGIDIERIKEINLTIAERFFAPEELDYLMSLHEKQRKVVFFNIWTLKESYLKALGTGLTRSLNSFAIIINEQRIDLKESGKTRDVFLCHLPVDSNHVLSLCSQEEMKECRIKTVEVDELLDFYND